MAKTIEIEDEYMTLSQLLKWIGAVQSGGEVKSFLQQMSVTVNDQLETRRGKKLYDGDTIYIAGQGVYRIRKQT